MTFSEEKLEEWMCVVVLLDYRYAWFDVSFIPCFTTKSLLNLKKNCEAGFILRIVAKCQLQLQGRLRADLLRPLNGG